MNHPCGALFSNEEVHCGEHRARQHFVTDHGDDVAELHGTRVIKIHLQPIGVAEDLSPAFHHRVAADKCRPSGMNADHGVTFCPDALHGIRISRGKSQIK